MQSVGYLQIIPLLSDLEDKRFVAPNEIHVSTCDYGSLTFENHTDLITIVPVHAGYVVKEDAQDHAMAHAGIIKQNSDKQYDTAMCIQQHQGGCISKGKHKLIILPFSLREKALRSRHQTSFGKLWTSISKFNKKLGAWAEGHLEYFLNKFETELDEFVAEFESVPKQVGAIILLDGNVVGIERTPSYSYWGGIWPALIRECYGSLAIEHRKTLRKVLHKPKSRFPLPDSVASTEELKNLIDETEKRQEEYAKEKIRDLLQDKFQRQVEEKVADLALETLVNNQFLGQIICQDDRIHYASLITKAKWRKNVAWYRAKPFSI